MAAFALACTRVLACSSTCHDNDCLSFTVGFLAWPPATRPTAIALLEASLHTDSKEQLQRSTGRRECASLSNVQLNRTQFSSTQLHSHYLAQRSSLSSIQINLLSSAQLAQLNSTELNPTQLIPIQLNSNKHNSTLLPLFVARCPRCMHCSLRTIRMASMMRTFGLLAALYPSKRRRKHCEQTQP
ncbi:hypothetical protein GQ42DRAFT_52960 [Ramicandelaber brevisporus]|nr:hypothetical protein GQ42DRAFT_52960 [Ramicandelaber brevisporus]